MCKNMSEDRWMELMKPFEEGDGIMMSKEEIDAGWHWCEEWDGLLIHVDDDEFVSCTCKFMDRFRTPERIKSMQEKIIQWRGSEDDMQKLADLIEELGLNPGNTA